MNFSFIEWMDKRSLNEMSRGYAASAASIKEMMWMAIAKKMSIEEIHSELINMGENITPRSIRRKLALYGLTSKAIKSIRKEAKLQSTGIDNANEPSIKDMIWMVLGRGINIEEMPINISKKLALCGLTPETLKLIRDEAALQANVSTHGGSKPASEANPSYVTQSNTIDTDNRPMNPYQKSTITPEMKEKEQARRLMTQKVKNTFRQKFGINSDSEVGRRISAHYGYDRMRPSLISKTDSLKKACDDPSNPQEIIRKVTGINNSNQ